MLTIIALVAALASGVGVWIFGSVIVDCIRDAISPKTCFPKADRLDHFLLAFAFIGSVASLITAFRQIIPNWLTF